mmetsp:Transcript_35667/g.44235  ORF Transcript_35667/g.44235 Transcript_35667/m.44235 type:complete len:520 (+) Transcript_35667:187-1746(+)
MSKTFSRSEVAKHNKSDDCFIIIDNVVYDVTKFAGLHPGGEFLLYELGGLDVTEDFYGLHRVEVLEKYGPRLKVGIISDADAKGVVVEPQDNFEKISKVPFAETAYWRGLHSPYYKESHVNLRLALRKFIKDEVREDAEFGEVNGKAPSKEILLKMGSMGINAMILGPGKHMGFFKNLIGGVKVEEFDYFHEQIVHEEFCRLMCPGYLDGLFAGMSISVPPLFNFGNERIRTEIGPAVLRGERRSCLAITEPYVGSDVANARTRAEKSACGTYYILNGVKKWITNGHGADYFITLARTGGPGAKGLSMFLVERTEGVSTKLLKTSYSTAAETTYVIFENVRVPAENLLGREGDGFMVAMGNFNHERYALCCGLLGHARYTMEEAFKWAAQRKVFGKTLINQPVIQEKFAKMVTRVESVHAWLETITHQMNNMNYAEQNEKLGGIIGLLKYEIAQVANLVADETVQILGGRGVTQGGMGRIIERFNRTYKLPAVYGGSSEIVASLGIRQAMKSYPRDAKL